MALDSYRPKETKKVTENPKTAVDFRKEHQKRIDEFWRTINELPIGKNNDIDQKWIKENESQELSFSNPNQNNNDNQRKQEVLDQMTKVGSFGGKTITDSEKQRRAEEWEELENLISGSKQATPEVANKQTEMIDSQQLENKKPGEETIESVDITSIKPPIIDPVISPTEEETKIEEAVIDNSALIEELNRKIDKKYNLIVSELSNLYNSEVINKEADSLNNDLQSLMAIKNSSLEELQKVDEALNSLISRLSKLSQKAEEIKTADDFRINQQHKQLNFLQDYQNKLMKNYGKYWFGKMTEEEKTEYINLYTAAHKVPREVVEQEIDDSIAMAYNEIIANKIDNNKTPDVTSNMEPVPEQKFNGEYSNIIEFNIRTGVEELKQIKEALKMKATKEQFEEFSYLYNALLELYKSKTTNMEEEQQKLTQSYDITERIEQLQSSLSIPTGKTR